jgi:hypothetical protein
MFYLPLFFRVKWRRPAPLTTKLTGRRVRATFPKRELTQRGYPWRLVALITPVTANTLLPAAWPMGSSGP